MSGSMFALRPEAREFTPSSVAIAATSVGADASGSTPMALYHQLHNSDGLLAVAVPQTSTFFTNRLPEVFSGTVNGALSMANATVAAPCAPAAPSGTPVNGVLAGANDPSYSSPVTAQFNTLGGAAVAGFSGMTSVSWTPLNPDAPPFVPTSAPTMLFDKSASAHVQGGGGGVVAAHHIHHHHHPALSQGRSMTSHVPSSPPRAPPLLHVSPSNVSPSNNVAVPLATGGGMLTFTPVVLSDGSFISSGNAASFHGGTALEAVNPMSPAFLPQCSVQSGTTAEQMHYHYPAYVSIAHHHHPMHHHHHHSVTGSPSYHPVAYQPLAHHHPAVTYPPPHPGSPMSLEASSYRDASGTCVDVVNPTSPGARVSPSSVGPPCTPQLVPSYGEGAALALQTPTAALTSVSFPMQASTVDVVTPCGAYGTDSVTYIKTEKQIEYYPEGLRKPQQSVGVLSSCVHDPNRIVAYTLQPQTPDYVQQQPVGMIQAEPKLEAVGPTQWEVVGLASGQVSSALDSSNTVQQHVYAPHTDGSVAGLKASGASHLVSDAPARVEEKVQEICPLATPSCTAVGVNKSDASNVVTQQDIAHPCANEYKEVEAENRRSAVLSQAGGPEKQQTKGSSPAVVVSGGKRVSLTKADVKSDPLSSKKRSGSTVASDPVSASSGTDGQGSAGAQVTQGNKSHSDGPLHSKSSMSMISTVCSVSIEKESEKQAEPVPKEPVVKNESDLVVNTAKSTKQQQRVTSTAGTQGVGGRTHGRQTGSVGTTERYDNRRTNATGVKLGNRQPSGGVLNAGRGKKYSVNTTPPGPQSVTKQGLSLPNAPEDGYVKGPAGSKSMSLRQESSVVVGEERKDRSVFVITQKDSNLASQSTSAAALSAGTQEAKTISTQLAGTGKPSWAERVRQGASRPPSAAVLPTTGTLEQPASVAPPVSTAAEVGPSVQQQAPSTVVGRGARAQRVPHTPYVSVNQVAARLPHMRNGKNDGVVLDNSGDVGSRLARETNPPTGGASSEVSSGTGDKHRQTGGSKRHVTAARNTAEVSGRGHQRRGGPSESNEKPKYSTAGVSSYVGATSTTSKKSDRASQTAQNMNATGLAKPSAASSVQVSTSTNDVQPSATLVSQTEMPEIISQQQPQQASRSTGGVSWATIARRPVAVVSPAAVLSSEIKEDGDGLASAESSENSFVPSQSTVVCSDVPPAVVSGSPSAKRKIGNAPLSTAHFATRDSNTTQLKGKLKQEPPCAAESPSAVEMRPSQPAQLSGVNISRPETPLVSSTIESTVPTRDTGSSPVNVVVDVSLPKASIESEEKEGLCENIKETIKTEEKPAEMLLTPPPVIEALNRNDIKEQQKSPPHRELSQPAVRRSGIKLVNAPLERVSVVPSTAVKSGSCQDEKAAPCSAAPKTTEVTTELSSMAVEVEQPRLSGGEKKLVYKKEGLGKIKKSPVAVLVRNDEEKVVEEHSLLVHERVVAFEKKVTSVAETFETKEQEGQSSKEDVSPLKPREKQLLECEEVEIVVEKGKGLTEERFSTEEKRQSVVESTVECRDDLGVKSKPDTIKRTSSLKQRKTSDSSVKKSVTLNLEPIELQIVAENSKVIEKLGMTVKLGLVEEAQRTTKSEPKEKLELAKCVLSPPSSLVYPKLLMLRIRNFYRERNRSRSTSPVSYDTQTDSTALPNSTEHCSRRLEGRYALPFLMSRKPESVGSRGLSLTTMATDSLMRSGRKANNLNSNNASTNLQAIWRGRSGGVGGGSSPASGAHSSGMGSNRAGGSAMVHRRGGPERSSTGPRDSGSAAPADGLDAWRLPAPPTKPSENSRLFRAANITDHGELIHRKLRAILNKLTVEKFDPLYEQIKTVGMIDADDVRRLMELICSKAKTQHHFIPMYVQLCVLLHRDLPNLNILAEDGQFRRLLVDACQASFEETLKPIVTPEGLSEDEAFEHVLFEKKKMKGNMIFVGELGKAKMIAGKVLSNCITFLLDNKGEPQLEALCVLLTTAGHYISSGKLKSSFQKQMEMVISLAQDTTLTTRMRCLLQDVVDDYSAGWKKAKRDPDGPKRLDDLHKELENEARQQRAAHPPSNRHDYSAFSTGFRHHSQRGHDASSNGHHDDDFQFVAGGRRVLRANRVSSGRDLHRLPSSSMSNTIDQFDRFRSTRMSGTMNGQHQQRFIDPSSPGQQQRSSWDRAPKGEDTQKDRPVMSFFAPAKNGATRPTASVIQPINSLPSCPALTASLASSNAPNVATPKPAAPAARLPFDVEKAKDQVETLLSNVATENFQETLETIKEYFTTHDVKDDDKAYLVSHALFLFADARVARQPVISKWLSSWCKADVISSAVFEQGIKDFVEYRYESTKCDTPNLRSLLEACVLKDAKELGALEVTAVETLLADIERADNAPPCF